MNTRICSVIAVATLLTLGSGCSGTRNFLFGRGARCGLCTKLTPQFGNTMQAPCGSAPYAPAAQAAPYQTPAYQGAVAGPSAGCGCNDNVGYASQPCGTCGESYAMQYGGCGCIGDCGCGNVDGYGPVVSDPYTQGGIIGGSMPYNGQIISDTVVGQQPMAGQVYPGTTPIQEDNFSARKFDSDGNKILWEEPLPQGTTAL